MRGRQVAHGKGGSAFRQIPTNQQNSGLERPRNGLLKYVQSLLHAVIQDLTGVNLSHFVTMVLHCIFKPLGLESCCWPPLQLKDKPQDPQLSMRFSKWTPYTEHGDGRERRLSLGSPTLRQLLVVLCNFGSLRFAYMIEQLTAAKSGWARSEGGRHPAIGKS